MMEPIDQFGLLHSLAGRASAFDRAHGAALRRIWVVGDVHGHRTPLLKLLERHEGPTPHWLVFLGDLDLDPERGTFEQWLQPVYAASPGARVAWIPGNHDSDQEDRWQRLQACGEAVPIHGRVVNLDGVRIAGLGGTFQGRVWYPPAPPVVQERRDLVKHPLKPHELRNRPRPGLHSAIYEAEWATLGALKADILITHEAPSCHRHGFEAIDDLARALGVVRSFHGHHHQDLSDQYRARWNHLGFQAFGLAFCGVRNGLGELIYDGEAGW